MFTNGGLKKNVKILMFRSKSRYYNYHYQWRLHVCYFYNFKNRYK